MSKKLCLRALGAIALGLLPACVTETVQGDIRVKTGIDNDTPRISRETDLKGRVEKDPKDAQGWFELGDYYETGLDFRSALGCYERGAALLDGTRYTGGNYLLARVSMRLNDFPKAMRHLDQIAAIEPKDARLACTNRYFREGHYLRGAIYYQNGQLRAAKKEFVRFIELGGDEVRVEEWIERIDSQRD